jgi:molybdate transport system regulatory protein
MTVGGEKLGGAGRVALLAPSPSAARSRRRPSGRHELQGAWDAIDAMNNLAGEPLVERLAGGKGGGGTRLTQRGRQLVDNFRIIEREHARFVRQLGSQADGIADDLLLIRRMAMKTSARNQFLASVTELKQGAVNDEVTLELPGGQQIVAVITQGSSASLGLAPGAEAVCADQGLVHHPRGRQRRGALSARNQLAGTVTRVQTGAVNTEVVLDLPAAARLPPSSRTRAAPTWASPSAAA